MFNFNQYNFSLFCFLIVVTVTRVSFYNFYTLPLISFFNLQAITSFFYNSDAELNNKFVPVYVKNGDSCESPKHIQFDLIL